MTPCSRVPYRTDKAPPPLPPLPPPRPVTLDHDAFPHILENVIACSKWESLFALRRLNRETKAYIDTMLGGEIVMYSRPGEELTVASRLFGPLPGFRFGGGFVGHPLPSDSREEQARKHAWLVDRFKKAHGIDLVGKFSKLYPFERSLSVNPPQFRLFPDENGQYPPAPDIGPKGIFIVVVDLTLPGLGLEKNWPWTAPKFPEGTTWIINVVHHYPYVIHCNQDVGELIKSGMPSLPSTVKRFDIVLVGHTPPMGHDMAVTSELFGEAGALPSLFPVATAMTNAVSLRTPCLQVHIAGWETLEPIAFGASDADSLEKVRRQQVRLVGMSIMSTVAGMLGGHGVFDDGDVLDHCANQLLMFRDHEEYLDAVGGNLTVRPEFHLH